MSEGPRKKRRITVEKSELRAKWPEKFQSHCAAIAAGRGLKVFERGGTAWATDGESEWIFYSPVNPKKLWFEAWNVLRQHAATLDQPR